jgi:hypothetical protein
MMCSAFGRAVEARDIAATIARLAPDVVFRSPVVFAPYEGREATGRILAAVVQVFEDFRYIDEITSDGHEALVFEARVGDRTLQGVDLIRLGDDGLVSELTVLIRPMSALLALAEAMRQRLEAAAPSP